MEQSVGFRISEHPVHLGLGARATVQEAFTGEMEWYARYEARTASDGVEGRLVSLHSFSAPWESWEMHPQGEELVVCTSGRLTLIQEIDGTHRRVTLQAGDAAINPAGVWHTADVEGETTALFVTAGTGTEVRDRRANPAR